MFRVSRGCFHEITITPSQRYGLRIQHHHRHGHRLVLMWCDTEPTVLSHKTHFKVGVQCCYFKSPVGRYESMGCVRPRSYCSCLQRLLQKLVLSQLRSGHRPCESRSMGFQFLTFETQTLTGGRVGDLVLSRCKVHTQFVLCYDVILTHISPKAPMPQTLPFTITLFRPR